MCTTVYVRFCGACLLVVSVSVKYSFVVRGIRVVHELASGKICVEQKKTIAASIPKLFNDKERHRLIYSFHCYNMNGWVVCIHRCPLSS